MGIVRDCFCPVVVEVRDMHCHEPVLLAISVHGLSTWYTVTDK